MKNVFCILLFLNLTLYAPYLTINTPGFVTLGEDISYGPTTINDTIIQINASNVILDFDRHRIFQTPGNLVAGLNGVKVAPGSANVTIRNGQIQNITGTGISVGLGCFTIIVDTITTFSANIRGFEFIGSTLFPINSLSLLTCNATACCLGLTGDYGMFLQNCTGIQLINCNSGGNGAITHNVSAVRIDNCSLAALTNVACANNVGLTSVRGFDFSTISGFLITNCYVANPITVAPGGSNIGFEMQASTTCNNLLFESCIVGNTQTIAASTSFIGFDLGATTTRCLFSNCKVTQNISSGSNIGFQMQLNATTIITNAIIQGNSSSGSTITGCLINSCTDIQLKNCVISNQNSLTSTAVGIEVLNCNACLFNQNTISSSDGINGAQSFGVRQTPGHADGLNVFVGNLAVQNGQNNAVDINQFSGFSASQMSVVNKQAVNSITSPLTNAAFI